MASLNTIVRFTDSCPEAPFIPAASWAHAYFKAAAVLLSFFSFSKLCSAVTHDKRKEPSESGCLRRRKRLHFCCVVSQEDVHLRCRRWCTSAFVEYLLKCDVNDAKSQAARWKELPQVSHGFSADQREDDVVVLLTLEPVDCCHLHGHTNTHRNIKDMLTKLLVHFRDLAEIFRTKSASAFCLKCFSYLFQRMTNDGAVFSLLLSLLATWAAGRANSA